MNGVQRFLHGGNNKVRTAVAMTGPVRPIEDAVLQKPVARSGSLVANISGIYTGVEEALYELQVLDQVADTPIVTAPLFIGVGNGEMQDIGATGLTVRQIEVTLADLGQVLKAATANLQGVTVMMKTPGADGNKFSLTVDRSALIFTPQQFTLLEDLPAGTSATPGPQYDWQTVTATADGEVPTTAKRLVFGEDRNNIYVQYKQIEDGKVIYHFEPETQQKYAVKTQVYFVTGSYTVKLWEDVAGVPTLRETYAGVVTLYDLLNAIRSTSAYLLVQGAVANDRTSGGQALLELTLNTDARIVLNTGEGSSYATGFTDTGVSGNGPTELIEATCIAATPSEASGAGLGHELWELRGSVTGMLSRTIASGDLFSNAFFSARIPQKMPPGYVNLPKGSFTVKEINYNLDKRTFNEEDETYSPITPPICVDSRTLGINAKDCVITLNYKKRPPTNNCSCKEDKGIALSPFCLGVVTDTDGGEDMPYQPETITRLVELYDWFADTVRKNSKYFQGTSGVYVGSTMVIQDPFISQPGPHSVQRDPALLPESVITPNTAYVSLFEMIKQFELTLAEVDKLNAGALKTAAEDAWDAAVTEFEGDVDENLSGVVIPETDEVLPAAEDLAAGDAVGVFYDGAVLKVRKATKEDWRYGYVDAAVLSGANATVKYTGINAALVSTVEINEGPPTMAMPYWRYYPSVDDPGQYVLNKGGTEVVGVEVIPYGALGYLSATSGQSDARTIAQANPDPIGMALLPDRYKSRLQFVLISGGISPLGKGDADTGSGDGCWRDTGDDFYWEVLVGEEKYANAFTGVPYYSSLKYPGGVVVNGVTTPSEGYYSTREFGFILDIPCKEDLVTGDQIVLVIGNAGQQATYQKGDRLILGIVSAQNVDFFGGNDGDNVQTWHVQDSVAGARDPYFLDTDAPVAYDDTELTFLITQGAIPYTQGDKYKFAIEGGNFRWRKTPKGGAPGAWSGANDITLAPFALDDGLSLEWQLGASPAIFTGDQYAFLALQPYALSNLIGPDFDRWEWAVDPAPLVIDLGTVSSIEAIALAFHTLPAGATVEVEGGTAPGVYVWSTPVDWRKDVMAVLLPVAENARYLRVTVTGSADGGIGWLYAGEAVKMTYSAQVQLQREYKVKRSDGVNPNSLYQGTGLSGTITYPEGLVLEDDYEKLTSMLDWLKSHDDEALVFYPQETRTDEIILATVESDEITFSDVFNFQPGDGYERRISCTIPLRGVAFK
jgi:hypothetical protein